MGADAIVIYGAPASGKDTITAVLCRLDPAYILFERLKIGGGRSDGYRRAADDEVDALRRNGLVVYENCRYGNTYVVDRPELDRVIAAGRIPIIHIGQLAGLRAINRYPVTWLSVLLWCPRTVARQRVQARGDADLGARLAAWDETEQDLRGRLPTDFIVRIDTEQMNVGEGAATIHAGLRVAATATPSA